MSTITLPNIRVSSDLTIRLKLKDGGVAIDWSTLQNIRVSLYADDQRSMASRCNVSIDEEDSTILVCQYAANKMQYLGVNRVIVQCKYLGEVKTYDKPAFTFVRWTSDQEGEQITIDDPDVDVEITVEDVSSSILQEAVDAAFDAADRANDAAAAAEHMVDIHTGPEGKSAYEVAVEEGYTGTEEEWLASLKGPVGETPDISIGTVTTVEPGTPAAASMTGTPEAPVLNLSIPKGLVGATPNFTVGTVTTGEPGSSVIVTITGTPEAPVLNLTIPQGMQGNTGSSVDYPYELVNNLTTNDATKGLSAAQGVVLAGQVSQLEHKVNGFTPLVLTLNNVEYAASGTVSQIYDCDFKQGQKITISASKSSGLTADFSVKYTFFNDSSYSQQEGIDLNTANTGEITLTRNSLKVRIYIQKSAVTGSGTLTANLEVVAGTSIVSQISALQSEQTELDESVEALNENITPLAPLNDEVIANVECYLVDSSSLLHGYISTSDGGFRTSEDWRATDYIRLKGGVKYFFGRFYAGYYAFYDLDKNHLPDAQYFHHINFGYGYILCPEDCYFRGSTASVELADYMYVSSVVDGYLPFGEKDYENGDYAKWAKTPAGSLSPNLFNGRCEIGGIENGQLRDETLSRVRTFPIYCSGTVYIKMFNGKTGDILYIWQYSSDGTYIGGTMLYTTEGVVALNESTAFIRICTTTRNDGYVPPTLDFYRTHLFVTELPDVFGKWLPSGYVISAKDVDDHFFDTASTFEVGYIKTALDTLIHTIKGVGYDAVIPCMTDIHLDDAEPYKMLNYLAASGVADACFNLGDTIRENFPTKAEAVAVLENDFRWSNSMPRKSPLLSLRGNHDTNPVSDASAMISTREYAALAENRTMPGYASNTVNYGYIDLSSKIRLVWLDTSDIFDENDEPLVFGNYTLIQQEQLDWLCNEALNFKDKKVPGDWSVIVLSHDGAVDLRLTAIIEAFVSGASASGTIVYDARKAVDMQTDVTVTLQYDVDFSEQGPVDMLCCVCGHYHKDKIADIGTSGVKQVYIACDNVVAHYDDDGTDETYDRTYGTIEEHICDTICVDKATRTVLFKRLGVGSDRVISYD